ncbi:3-dehydroquinate synthase [Anaerococcus sp. AGMB00486]|uniref:3-dehydroquinate synthase n=2 Tax=Anaerococcus TaxID=165779 RepID=A0ABX2N9K0_9FIRM|nr:MULTISPECIES: 3-dehydroquinate synthase [Anaerococcus]MSS78467.1 3-dehydroquinate synthase [Anaerococcus porci]NVF11323.1 3-dehydroquinate synthase [Anaerococcus faecalis]
MKLRVDLDKPYDIEINAGSINCLNRYLKENYKNSKILLVSDDLVFNIHKEKILKELDGFFYKTYILKNGESSKNTENLIEMLEFAAKNEYRRSDLVLAFGGGVVGDITGLFSNLYLRGLDFIAIPTTFLSAIDSSVGGKTAVNLKEGKNLCGTFYQPKKVFIDTDFLKTLSDYTFNDGLAEAIKYAMIRDKSLLKKLMQEKIDKNYENLPLVIKSCLDIKREVVREDEKDLGIRQILNYGHTFGHAIEKKSNFKIGHGHAVALGMLIMVKYFNEDFYNDFLKLLEKYGLYDNIDFNTEEILKLCMVDKKSRKDRITIIAVKEIGSCELIEIGLKDLRKIYENRQDYN